MAEAWDKVRQTLERDGLEGALTAGPDAQTIRIQQKAGLRASGPDEGNNLGYAMAINGDTAVVGASGKNSSAGAAYIFKRDAGGVIVYRRDQGGPNQWGYFKTLEAEDGAAFDQLGFSLALDGDTLVAGALFKDLLAGAAYVFQAYRALFLPLILKN